MASTNNEILLAYVNDLVAVLRHVGGAIQSHAGHTDVIALGTQGRIVSKAAVTLSAQLSTLEQQVKALGGPSVMGTIKETLTAVTSALTGAYGAVRGETASRMLRDDYTGLSFVAACTNMLHTTALAVGDERIAEITQRHLQDVAALINEMSDAVPFAVVRDLQHDNKVALVNAEAAAEAVRNSNDAWRSATAAS